MLLAKGHREALLNELEKANADLKIQSGCLAKEAAKENGLASWFEISEHLAQERIKLIKKAIADNEIDY